MADLVDVVDFEFCFALEDSLALGFVVPEEDLAFPPDSLAALFFAAAAEFVEAFAALAAVLESFLFLSDFTAGLLVLSFGSGGSDGSTMSTGRLLNPQANEIKNVSITRRVEINLPFALKGITLPKSVRYR